MKKLIITGLIIIIIILISGNTHHILPATMDDCQTDLTHEGHIGELNMYHCIGHTEYVVDFEKEGLFRIKKWDHIHPWMTLEWHLEQGFTREHAKELISFSSE